MHWSELHYLITTQCKQQILTAVGFVGVVAAVVAVVALGGGVDALVARRAAELVQPARQRLARAVLLVLARSTV